MVCTLPKAIGPGRVHAGGAPLGADGPGTLLIAGCRVAEWALSSLHHLALITTLFWAGDLMGIIQGAGFHLIVLDLFFQIRFGGERLTNMLVREQGERRKAGALEQWNIRPQRDSITHCTEGADDNSGEDKCK